MLLVAAGAAHAGALAPQKASANSRMTTAQGQRLWAARSAHFVENKGQWKPQARFYAKGKGVDLWFTDHGIRYDQRLGGAGKFTGQAVDMSFVGGRPVRFVGQRSDGAHQDVLRGKTAVSGIRSYRELVSRNVVDGVDLRAYYENGVPRYDLVVAPGTQPSAVRLAFRGANGLRVQDGALKVGTKLGGFFNGKPFAYQTVDGKRRPVFAKWVLRDAHTAGFSLGAYDANKPLVIDPLVFGTYFGGDNGNDEVRAAVADTFDTTGSAYIVGRTTSPDFPANYGPFNDSFNPARQDAFIARVSANGTVRDYAALFGSGGDDVAQYVKLDAEGNVWVAGTTTNGAGFFSPTFTVGTATGNSFFVIRFARNTAAAPPVVTPTTQGVVSAVFGMANNNKALTGFDIQPGATGSLRFAFSGVTLDALTTDIIPNGVGGIQNPTAADIDNARSQGHFFESHRTGFLVRFAIDNSTGDVALDSDLSQYIEGTRINETRGVVLDAADNAYVVGTLYKDPANLLNVDTSVGTNYRFFETTSSAFSNLAGVANGYATGRIQRATDVFVRKYYPSATFRPGARPGIDNPTFAFSGLLGGNGDDDAGGITSTPTQLNPNTIIAPGSAVQRPLYTGTAIALGPVESNATTGTGQSIYVTGTVVLSNNFPITVGTRFDANPNVFAAKVTNNGDEIVYAANLGVNSHVYDTGTAPASYYNPWIPTTVVPAGIAVDANGYAFITGNLRASGITFPTTTPGTPNEPTASTLSSISLPANLTDVPDPTYDSPSGNELPTTEGFLIVLNPLGNGFQYGTYVGGILDDMVFAPSLNPQGNVYTPGWSDGIRNYLRIAGTTVKVYFRNGVSLPNNLLTAGSVKHNPHSGATATDTLGYGFWATAGDQTAPSSISLNPNNGEGIGRDGFILKFDVNLPILNSIVFSRNGTTKTDMGDGYGAFLDVQANLSRTSGGNTTVPLTIQPDGNGVYHASFSPTTDLFVKSVTVAQGQSTSASIRVYSRRLPYTGATLPAAQTVDITGINAGVTVTGTLTVKPWLNAIAVTPTSVVGGSTTAVSGTVTLNDAATPELIAAPIVLDAVNAFNNPVTSVHVSTLTLPLNSTTGTYTVTTDGIDTSVNVSIRARLTDPAALQTVKTPFSVSRANLLSLTYAPSPVPAGSPTTGTLTLDGTAGPNGFTATITGTPASASDLPKTVTIPAGQTSVSFTVNTKFVANDPTVVTTTATPANGGSTVTGTFTISKFAIVSLSFSPNPIDPGGTSTGTVTLNTAATSATRIDIAVTNFSKITVVSGLVQDGPGQYHLTISAGSNTASFVVKSVNIGAQNVVGFTASRINGDSATANLTIKALNFTLTLNPNTVIGSSSPTVTGTITLTTAAPENLTFVQTSSDTSLVPIGADGSPVVILAGQKTATFTLHPVSSLQTKSVTITSTVNDLSKTAVLVIQPPSVIKLTPVQKTVRGGDYLDLDALFDATPITSHTRLVITVSQKALFSGSLDNFPVNGNPTRIRLRTNRVSRSTNVTVTVRYEIRSTNDQTVLSTSEASTTVTIAR